MMRLFRRHAMPLPGSAVFFDVPNIRTRGWNEHLPREIDWRMLCEHIVEHSTRNSLLVHAGAYSGNDAELNEPRHHLESVVRARNQQFLYALPRLGHDIDSWLMNDIWMATVLYHEHKVPDKRLRDPFTMRIVLVSGDGGYLRSFKTLLTTYHNLKLEIVVYSWKDKLSNHLAQIPGVRVYYLDDVLANSMKKVPCT